MNTAITKPVKGNKITVKKFSSSRELYEFLNSPNLPLLQKECKEKYGPNKGAIDFETMELIITIS